MDIIFTNILIQTNIEQQRRGIITDAQERYRNIFPKSKYKQILYCMKYTSMSMHTHVYYS